jgi:hypothetical protein
MDDPAMNRRKQPERTDHPLAVVVFSVLCLLAVMGMSALIPGGW